ncbi:MAG: protease self-immunity family protein [Thermoleophilia bacterium]|nr:protease self-immunity family protein [Thermoleophilia bacterium]
MAQALLLGVVVVLAFIFFDLLAGVLLQVLGFPVDLSGDIQVGEVLTLCAMKLVSILAAVAFVMSGYSTWQRIGLDAPPPVVHAGLRALAPVGVLVIGLPLGASLASGDALFDSDLTPGLAAAFVAASILIAVSEELWFRGVLVDVLESARMPWLTIAASSVLFGLPHLPGGSAAALNALAVTLAVGVPFTIVRLRCGSIIPLIIWHAVIDAWAFLHTASVTAQGSPGVGEAVATLVVPALVALGYVWWYRRGRRITS